MHDCIQSDNIKRIGDIVDKRGEVIGALTEAVKNINGNIIQMDINIRNDLARLDKRINGSFDTIGEHIKESPIYRGEIERLKVEVKNIKEEKNNTTKDSQWRIGLICAVPGILMALIEIFKFLGKK